MSITTYAEWMREEFRMREINGHRIYYNEDIEEMLVRLDNVDNARKEEVIEYVKATETGMDRTPLLAVVNDPSRCCAEYFDRFDSAVADKFIWIMEKFNLAY